MLNSWISCCVCNLYVDRYIHYMLINKVSGNLSHVPQWCQCNNQLDLLQTSSSVLNRRSIILIRLFKFKLHNDIQLTKVSLIYLLFSILVQSLCKIIKIDIAQATLNFACWIALATNTWMTLHSEGLRENWLHMTIHCHCVGTTENIDRGSTDKDKAYTKKVLVSGREAPENLTRSVGLFFYFGLFFFILCHPPIQMNTQDMHAPKHHCMQHIAKSQTRHCYIARCMWSKLHTEKKLMFLDLTTVNDRNVIPGSELFFKEHEWLVG